MSEKYCIGCGAAYGQEHAMHCVKYIKPVDEVPFTYENECKLRQEIEALKEEVKHQKERKASIGNEVDKWRNRAVANLSRAEKAEAERDSLRESLKRIADGVTDCEYKGTPLCSDVAKNALNHKEG